MSKSNPSNFSKRTPLKSQRLCSYSQIMISKCLPNVMLNHAHRITMSPLAHEVQQIPNVKLLARFYH